MILCGCSHECPDSFKEESGGTIRAFIEELSTVKTSSDLLKKQKKVRKFYEALADQAIRAKKWAEKHPGSVSCDEHSLDDNLSEILQKELERIYTIEGAQEIMEEAQKESIERLDEFLHKQSEK